MTPSLAVDEAVSGISTEVALHTILNGGRISVNSWHQALDILVELGLSPEEAMGRYIFAKTGRCVKGF